MTKEEAIDLVKHGVGIEGTGNVVCGCVPELGEDGLVAIIGEFLTLTRDVWNVIRELPEETSYSLYPSVAEECLQVCNGDWQYYYAIAVLCDLFGYTEHGSSIRGAWITPRGEQLLEALSMVTEEDL